MWNKTKSAVAALKARPLAIVLLLLWWLACWWGTGAWLDDEAQEAYRTESLAAERFVANAAQGFDRIVTVRTGMPKLLARDPALRQMLTRVGPVAAGASLSYEGRKRRWTDDPLLAATSRRLKSDADDLGLSAVAMIDTAGNCIAASNAGTNTSFVGVNYGGRDYFLDTLAGRSGYRVTVGKQYGSAGIAFFAPIMEGGRVIGGVAGRIDLAPFGSWLASADAFLTDRNGVVMLSPNPALVMRAMVSAPVRQLDAATMQALYRRTEFGLLDIAPWGDARFPELRRVDGRAVPVVLRSRAIASGNEPVVNVLWPLPKLVELAQQRLAYAGALGSLGSVLMLLAVVYASRRREQQAMALALAQREQQAVQARNFLDQIVDAIADPLFVKDSEHRWVLVNQAFCKIHGQPRENFIGKVARDAFPERIAERIWEADERVLSAGIEIIAEEKLIDSQGATHIVVTKKASYTDAAGQRFIVGIISDISERKQVERLLRAREREFRTLAENSPDPIYRYDRDGRRLYVNAMVCKLSGKPAEEFIGKSLNDDTILPPDERRKLLDAIRRVFDSGENVHLDLGFVTRAGEYRDYQMLLAPERDEQGQVSTVLAMARDITAIRSAERRVSHFLSNLPGFVYSFHMSPDGHFSFPFASRGIQDIYGLRAEDVKDDMAPLHALAHPEDAPRIEAAITESARTMTPFLIEVRVRRAGLPERWIECRALPERDADGGILWHGVMLDIDERKRLELALQQNAAQLRYHSNLLNSVLESAADVSVWALDRDYCYLTFNAKHRENSKRLRGADIAVGMSPLDLIKREELREVSGQAFDRVLAGHSICVEIREEVVQEGCLTYEYYEHHGSPIRNDEGEVVGLTLFTHNITERKAIEKAFRDSEQMLQEAQRIARVGSWDVDMVNDKLTWSDEVFRIWEIDKTKFKADFMAFLETVHPNDRERVAQAYNDAVINHSLYEVEHRLLFPDGRVKHILERGEPQYDAQGKPVRFIGTSLDITERKRMEEMLAAREREFRSLAENLPDNISRWDVDGCYLYINPIHERTMGVSANDLLGKAIPDSHTVVRAAIAQVVATGQAATLVRQPVVVNGETQIHEVSLAPEFDDAGHVVSVLGIGRDMTDILRMQAALAASEQEFRSLAENLPVAVIRYDSECRRRYLNQSAQRMLHGGTAELLGLVPGGGGVPASPAMIGQYRGKMDEVLATGTERELDFVLDLLPADQCAYYEVRFVPEHGADEKTRGVLAIWYDITERKRMEDQLAQREREFRSLAESSPDFIVRYDREGRHLYFNGHLLKLLGLASADEALGKRPGEAWRDGRFAELEQVVARVMESGNQGSLEITQPTESVAFRYHQLFVVPERDASGQIIGAIAFGREITAIREAERKLAHFIDNLPGLAYTFRQSPDGNGSFSYVSPSIEAIYGLRPEDVLDDASMMHALEHPEDRPRIEAASASARQTLQPFRVEFRVRRPGHPERWIESRSMPERQADGELLWHGIMLDITGRKQAEIALQENFGQITVINAHLERQARELTAFQQQLQRTETWYRSILRSAPDGMLVMDGSGVIVQVNAQLETLFGYEERELIGSHVEMLLPAVIRDMHVKKRVDFVASGRVDRPMASTLNLRACRKDGSEFPVDISLSQLPNMDGRVGAICAAIRDITEHKRSQRQLTLMNFALDHVGESMYLTDENASFQQVNTESCRALGYSRDELIGMSVFDINPGFRPEHWQTHWQTITSVRSRTIEGQHRTKDGRLFPVEISSNYFEFEGKGYNLSMVRDITERKRAQDALAGAHGFLDKVVDGISDPVFVKDRQHRWVMMNDAFCSLVGQPREVLREKSDHDFLPKDQADIFWEMDELVFESGETNVNEEAIAGGDGALHYIQTKKTPFLSNDGQMLLVGVIRDITERRLAEERLRQSRDIVRALAAHKTNEHEKDRKELAHQIHEDLAQNLAALRMKISMVEMCGEPTARAALLKTMHDIAQRSIARIRDIVSMLRPTVLDLGLIPALHWLIDDFKGIGLQFDVALRDDILVSEEVSTLLFRATQEALLNIALHAAATRVHVSLDCVDGHCHLRVRDNGCGFDAAAPRPDDRFGLIDLTEQAQYLGGDLVIDSAPERGTVLHMRVPGSSGAVSA